MQYLPVKLTMFWEVQTSIHCELIYNQSEWVIFYGYLTNNIY